MVVRVDRSISGGKVSTSGSESWGSSELLEWFKRFEICGVISGRTGFEYIFVRDCARDRRSVEVFDSNGSLRSKCVVMSSVMSPGENANNPPPLKRENWMIFVMTYI